MQVWPFIVLTLGLTIGLGFVIANVEMDKIMDNWTERRCEVSIMAMASYFKPKDDPRTTGQFAKDNMSFCMDSLVKTVTSTVLSPITSVFSSQMNVAGMASNILNVLRKMIATMYEKFLGFIGEFFKKYQRLGNQVRTVTLHLKAAFDRLNAIVLGIVFTGLTVIKGIMNSIDYIFFVVLIILAIMIVLLIILFFILLPFMPIIMSVIIAIIAAAIGAMAGEAASYKASFCFAGQTLVCMADGSRMQIQDIRLGNILAGNICVDSIMKMSGKSVPLWTINGIYVSGSHLVEMLPNVNQWHPVAHDPRARKTQYTDGYIYCLNTSSHTIPIAGIDGTIVQFKDWEELTDDDIFGHFEWNYRVIQALNSSQSYTRWSSSLNSSIHYPALAPYTLIKTPEGSKLLSELHIGDIVYDHVMHPTEVIGVIHVTTCVEKHDMNNQWATNMLYKDQSDNIWKRMPLIQNPVDGIKGMNLITEDGTFMSVNQAGSNIIYRDFTEVGYKSIETINVCVENRLRVP